MTERKKLSDVLKDLGGFRQSWQETKPAADLDTPIPAGTYTCSLTAGEVFQARTGTPGYKVTLRVAEGPHAGRLVFHDFYLTPAALPYTLRDLARIGITDPAQLDAQLPAGLVVKARIVVRKQNDGSERNELRSWELVAVNAPAEAGTPTPTMPWAVDLTELADNPDDSSGSPPAADDPTAFCFGANRPAEGGTQ